MGGEKYNLMLGDDMGVVGMGCGGGLGGGVCCLLEVPQGCSCQVNILQCTLEGVKGASTRRICVTAHQDLPWLLPPPILVRLPKLSGLLVTVAPSVILSTIPKHSEYFFSLSSSCDNAPVTRFKENKYEQINRK